MTFDRIPRIVGVAHREGHVVHLRFDDGVEGDVDLAPIIAPFTGVLAPLADPAFVAQVRVHPEFNTITWPGELDLDPIVLHCAVRGVPVPTYEDAPRTARQARRSGRRAAARATSSNRTTAGKAGGGGKSKRATRR
jgi:hypothetical protein